jgi:MarR family transcriptional regulator, negative regulator of the multidrug operon emrRAB
MVSVQINNPDSPLDKLEDNLRSMASRMPGLPFNELLVCRLVMYASREMAAGLEQKIRPFGLSEPEFRVLTTLFSQPDGVAHPSDLCSRASQSPANMSRISDALVSRDLITRVLSLHDRRRMVLRITEQGEELVRQLYPTLFQSLRETMSEFSEMEQHQMIAQLKRLCAQMEQYASRETSERAP